MSEPEPQSASSDDESDDPRWQKLDELSDAMADLDAACKEFFQIAESRKKLGYLHDGLESIGIHLPDFPEEPDQNTGER